MSNLKFGIAYIPNNFNYDLLDNPDLSFRDLKIILIAGPFNSIKEASESLDSFYSSYNKFGHEKLIINYDPLTMRNIEF